MSDEQACIFCLISGGKVQAAKVYDDSEVLAFLDIRPATEGHIQVISKAHAPVLNMLPPEVKTKMLNISLGIGESLIQKLGAKGVTYLINEGAGAGQRVPHASIQVIPRYEGDGLTIAWEEKQLNQEEINAYLQKVVAKLQGEGKPKEAPKQKVEVKEEPKKKEPEKESIEVVEERVPRYW